MLYESQECSFNWCWPRLSSFYFFPMMRSLFDDSNKFSHSSRFINETKMSYMLLLLRVKVVRIWEPFSSKSMRMAEFVMYEIILYIQAWVNSILRHNGCSVDMTHLNRIWQIIPMKNNNMQRTVTNATTTKERNQSCAIKRSHKG